MVNAWLALRETMRDVGLSCNNQDKAIHFIAGVAVGVDPIVIDESVSEGGTAKVKWQRLRANHGPSCGDTAICIGLASFLAGQSDDDSSNKCISEETWGGKGEPLTRHLLGGVKETYHTFRKWMSLLSPRKFPVDHEQFTTGQPRDEIQSLLDMLENDVQFTMIAAFVKKYRPNIYSAGNFNNLDCKTVEGEFIWSKIFTRAVAYKMGIIEALEEDGSCTLKRFTRSSGYKGSWTYGLAILKGKTYQCDLKRKLGNGKSANAPGSIDLSKRLDLEQLPQIEDLESAVDEML